MNLLDYIILTTVIISSFIGAYNGFTISVLNMISFFVSWIASFLFYPLISKLIFESKLYDTLMYYSDGASKITSISDRALPVSAFNKVQITDLISNMNLSHPFDKLIRTNLINHSLKNVQTVGEYFQISITNIIVNILSFLMLFVILRVAFMIIISIAKNVTDLPVLKQFDTLLGAGLGFIRGFLIVFLFFAIVPIFLTLVPMDIVTEFIDNSLFAGLFYKYNIFTNLIKGII